MTPQERKVFELALEALEWFTAAEQGIEPPINKTITAIKEALAQPEQDNTYNYAKSLAETIFKQHFAIDEHYASGRIVWGVNDSVIGILTQIDNMVADMVRKPAQPEQEPVAWLNPVWPKYCGPQSPVTTYMTNGWVPLYTTPPQRKPLTDGKIMDMYNEPRSDAEMIAFARAIEAAHGIGDKT